MPASEPYLETWLRRTRKQLGPSGRLSEVALILARSEGLDPKRCSAWLRSVLDGGSIPSPDQLTAIDTVLARPERPPVAGDTQACLL